MEMIAALGVFILVAFNVPTVSGVTCYQCSGVSGYSTLSTNLQTHCGLPFLDNDANNLLPKSTCDGVCVTSTFFGYAGGSTVSTVDRLCTDVPVTDGCEMIKIAGIYGLTCIRTCSTELCNTESDATSLLPTARVSLLMSAAVAVIMKGRFC